MTQSTRALLHSCVCLVLLNVVDTNVSRITIVIVTLIVQTLFVNNPCYFHCLMQWM